MKSSALRLKQSVKKAARLLKSSSRPRRQLNASKTLYEKLDDYQQHAVDWSMERQSAGLFFEQGTGKTWITGGVVAAMWRDDAQFLLVVPLTNKITTWLKFLRGNFPAHCIFDNFEDFISAPTPRVLVLHYEELTGHKKNKHGDRKVDWRFVKKLAKLRWSLIAFDESHRLKDRNTLQSKAAGQLRNSAERKMVLSGTPIESNPQDLWGQFRFFAPEVFGTSYKDFENTYLEEDDIDLGKYRPGSFMFHKMMRLKGIMRKKRKFDQEMMPIFLRKIQPHALRVTKDVLNLKELRVHPTPVTLRGNQRRVYESLDRNMVSSIHARSGSMITAPLKVTQLGKLQQVCGGYVFDDDGEVHEVGRAKIRAALSIIKNHQKPIVVFCKYLEEVWALHDELIDTGLRIQTLTGKSKKGAHRAKIQTDFQDGKTDVLICQIRTGGVGIDLFRSCVAIFYSLTYSFIDYEQALSRLHRRGQEQAVDIFLLYALGTVDEDIYEAIVAKRKVTEQVLQRLKREGVIRDGKSIRSRRPRQEARSRASIRPRRIAQPRREEKRRRQV